MCGITAVFNKSGLSSDYLRKANTIISHRGPDDEGYLLWKPGALITVLSGSDTSEETQQAFHYPSLTENYTEWTIGLGHRRLSILDLSPGGHQPMVLPGPDLVISFNGEVYNYIEIRDELQKLGHHFHTGSDTEVILHAWSQWGTAALNRFNGMFAFVLLDVRQQKLFAVRDRFGVKPLFYSDTSGYMAFASEVKQLRELPNYTFNLNDQIAYDYLRYALVDHDPATFEKGISQLMPGHFIELDIRSGKWIDHQWYSLSTIEWKGTEAEACDRFYELLKDSVKLRMRSDVPVGSALSGGLDSSTIVSLMRKVLEDEGHGDHLLKTITSCSEDKKYDEWDFAVEVINKVKAEPHKTFPSFEKLQQDLDRMIWHMDYPFGSTSQFSQWCVFEEAKKQGLTVMIDGQGADEQLAGYGGNDMALYAGLFKKGNLRNSLSEARSYKARYGNWPIGFLLGAFQINFPGLVSLFPKRYRPLAHNLTPPAWLKSGDFENHNFIAKSLRDNLVQQIQVLPLSSLLRYEDRNSMAFSIESRVPFMDYRLIEFTLGLPEELIYRKGERKYILRKAFRGLVPDKILDRTDKMGFVSAEERWLKQEGKDWFCRNIESSSGYSSNFVDAKEMQRYFEAIQNDSVVFNFDSWRVICFGRWISKQ